MTRELEVIDRLRRIATAPEARGLLDDAAVMGDLVITHDTIAEGVHFMPFDPPASVGWKLVAVNLSDLAAKGAAPAGALLSLTIGSGDWDMHFLTGIEAACESYGLPLLGGDTIALPDGAPRVLGLTAIGRAAGRVPDRAGGRSGDILWLVGTLGDAAGGLAILRHDRHAEGVLVDIYRRPVPLLGAGEVLAPRAQAMMDVSDGLLLDARRMARGERLRRRHRTRRAALIERFRRRARAGSGRPPVRRDRRRRLRAPCRFASRSRPGNTFFTKGDEDQPHRRARQGQGDRPHPRRPADRSCRRHWGLSTRALTTIAGFPLRQWAIGLSGLVCGMALALLIR